MGFCPIIKGECREECEFVEDGECLCAEGLRGLRAVNTMFDVVDNDYIAEAFEFFALLREAPIYQNTNGGSIPWIRVVASIEED